MEMGKEIRRLRNDRGLTQEALAAALNVTAQTVSKWECGNSIPDVQMLPEIAVYFGVTIDQLFAMTPEQQPVQRGRTAADRATAPRNCGGPGIRRESPSDAGRALQ